ncbi:MAG: cytidylate kinase [Patescibacteria group bacterium]|nr:MAG: cytidylate kinase [Patescibacteria group bacterium]
MYDNITISGKIAVGTTTLFENLKKELKPKGWKFRSTGQIIREITQEKTSPSADLAKDSVHKQLERKAKALLDNETHWVIEGWLAGYTAKDNPTVLKVLLICSDEDLRVKRFAQRENLNFKQAKKIIQEREEKNLSVWQRIYNTNDFWNKDYYDLIIDTSVYNADETKNLVLEKLNSNL